MYIHRRSSPSEPSQVCPVLFESLEPRLLLTQVDMPEFVQMDPFGSMAYVVELTGELEYEEASDGYKFYGLAGESISIGVVPGHPLLDPSLRILNLDTENWYLTGISTPGPSTYYNNFILSDDAFYAVVVPKYSGSGTPDDPVSDPYDLTIVKNALLVPDEFDDAANDSPANALDLDSGFVELFDPGNGAVRTAVYSNAAAVEVDYYSFTVAAGDSITLQANSTSGSDVQIVLSKDGVDLVTGASGETSYISGYIAGEAGTYVVKVTPATDPGYSLTVLKNADIAAADNSDIANPWEIGLADVILGGVGGADTQYFRFYQSGGKTAITTSTPIGSLLDPKIELFNDAGGSIATDSNSDPDGKNAYIFEDLATGWYKIAVGSDSQTGEYVLKLDKQIKILTSSPFDTEWVTTVPGTAVITFSANLDSSTVTSDDLLIKGGSLDQAGEAATGVTVDGDTATFTLPAGLVQSSYTLEIAAAAIADDRGVEVEAFSSSFVYSDPITVVSSSPSDTEWVTTRPDSVVITFSADVDPTTVAITDLVINDGDVEATNVTVSGNQVTFTLPAGLVQSSYTLEIAAAAMADDRGVGIVAFSSSFVYSDPIAVVSLSPFDTEWVTTVPGTAVITFSANLDSSTVTSDDLLIKGGSLDQAGEAATGVTVDGDTATFTLPAGLVQSSYTLEIAAAAIADDRGVEVEAFSSSFVYSDPITVVSSSPSDTEWVTTRPDSVVITFSADVDPTTVAITDLVINDGDVEATNVTVSGNQVTFTLPAGLVQSSYTLEIAAAAMADDRGVGIVAFSSSFEYTDPVTVISSSVEDQDVIPSGTLRFSFQFSRSLYEDSLDPSDVELLGGAGPVVFDEDNDYFHYDSASSTLHLAYKGLDQNDIYALSLISGEDAFRSLAGGGVEDRYSFGFITQSIIQGRPTVLSFGSGAPAIYTDSNDNEVRIALSGPGAGEVYFEVDFDGNLFPSLVDVVGTTGSSYLTITTAAGVETTIQKIEVHGPLAALTGKTTDLRSVVEDEPTAEINVDGKLGRLVLDDLLDDTEITINDSNSAVGAKYTTNITFDQVENCVMEIKQIPISTLTATSWEDGEISAPWIKTVRIKGDVKRSIRGDFGADLDLSSYKYHPRWSYALENLFISGKVTTASITATSGGIKQIEVAQWDAGEIQTKWVRKIRSKGSVRDQLAGDFGATLVFSSYYIRGRNAYSIDTLIIAGEMFNASGQSTMAGSVRLIKANSTGASLDINVTGGIDTFYAFASMEGTMEAGGFGTIKTHGELSADITATSYERKKYMSIKILKAGWASDATIDVLRGIGTIIMGQWEGGAINAGFINRLNINGRGDNADGRFHTNLGLTGAGAPKYTLSNAIIAGSIIGDDGDEAESNDKNYFWEIVGDARTIIIKGDVSNWKLTCTGDIKTLKLGAVDSTEAVANPDDDDPDNDDNTFYTDIVADGDIYNFQISQWIEGRIEANAIHSMSTRRQRNVVNSGKLANATIELTGSYGRSATALGKLNVNGNIENTTIDAATGGVGTVKAWTWDGGELAASNVSRITTNKATSFTADLDIVGVVSYVRIAGNLQDADWSARSFFNILIKGHLTETSITASQMPHKSINAIGNLVVKNVISDSRIKTTGHIKSIRAGAMIDSTVFAGPVTERDELPAGAVDSVWDLPDPSVDLYLADNSLIANIYNFTITGKTSQPLSYYFTNSNIAAAGDMGTVSLVNFTPGLTGTPFGLAADRIGTLKITATKDIWKNLETVADSFLSGDFQVGLV